jgi:hypothetical protein
MKPINPSISDFGSPQKMLRWAQSIFKTIYNGLRLSDGAGVNSDGVFNTFAVDNGDGIMLRIGAAGSAEAITWDAGTSEATLNYQLVDPTGVVRQPIGFIVCDLDDNAVIWRSVTPPTGTKMVLKTNNTAANATVYIF